MKKVQQGEGLRTGELVDADLGEYGQEEAAPEPPQPAPEPEPTPEPPKVKVDKVKIARAYLKEIRQALAKNKKYPRSAQKMGLTGKVKLSFTIQPNGEITDIKLKTSSGHHVLDEAAVETLEELSGKMPTPKELGQTPLKSSVILRYELD